MPSRHSADAARRGGRHRATISTFAVLVGLAFLALGVLGLIPGVTTHYREMTFSGPESGAMLFGLFQVSVLLNLIYLLSGVLGLAMAWTALSAFIYLLVGGLAYLGLWVYGLVVDMDSSANVLSLNAADNWLHLGFGAGMILLGLVGWAAARPRRLPAD